MPNFITDFQSIPSWHLFLIIVFLVAVFVYGLSLGKNRLVAALISIYFSFIITQSIPWQRFGFLQIKSSSLANYEIFLFLALILAILFLLPQSGFGLALRLHKRGRGSGLEIFILSILQVGLLICLIISFLPSKVVVDLHPLLKKFFVGDEMKSIWLSLPIIGILLLGRKREE